MNIKYHNLPLRTLSSLKYSLKNSVYSVGSVVLLYSKIFLVTIILLINGMVAFAEPKEPFVYNSYDKRDPFIPLVTRESEGVINTREVLGTKISLQAILRSKGKSFAIINNSVLSVGKKVPGTKIKITKILDDRVIFFYRFNEYELRLKKGVLFRPIIRGGK